MCGRACAKIPIVLGFLCSLPLVEISRVCLLLLLLNAPLCTRLSHLPHLYFHPSSPCTPQNNIALVGNKIDLEKDAGIMASEFTDPAVHAEKCKVRLGKERRDPT